MAKVYLVLPGPPEAAYPNGGDEAYWMGRVAGALAAHLHSRGIPVGWGVPQGEGFCLALCSQRALPPREGREKGPQLLFRPGDCLGQGAAQALAGALAKVYPQPELIRLEEGNPPELEGLPLPGAAARLLYRDNPQDEAWLAGAPGRIGAALALGLSWGLPHA